jgi:hypothetical protein
MDDIACLEVESMLAYPSAPFVFIYFVRLVESHARTSNIVIVVSIIATFPEVIKQQGSVTSILANNNSCNCNDFFSFRLTHL